MVGHEVTASETASALPMTCGIITSAAPKTRGGRTPALSLAQLEAFEAFFSADLGEGALSFTAIDPFDCVERTFRFVGSYEVSRSGRYFSITAELEILP